MKNIVIVLISLFFVPMAFSDGLHIDDQHFRILDTDGDAMFSMESTSFPGGEWEIIAGDDGGFYIRDKTAGIYRFAIDTSGNVGIGTTSPNYNLDVSGTIETDNLITTGNVGIGTTDSIL